MGKRSACRRTPFVAAVAFLIGPERQRPADDGTCGDGSEVTAVEAVSDLPIHAEDFADADDTAALPEIGSASCRARGCKYVSISVVVGELKKKKSKLHRSQ